MKSTFAGLLLITMFFGCTPSVTSSAEDFSFSNPGAEYSKNVSMVYGMQNPAAGMKAYNIQWKDSLGTVHSLSEYKGKPIVVSFWNNAFVLMAHNIDTLATIMGDSVKVLSMSTNSDVVHSFAAVQQFVAASGIRQQVIVDSGGRVRRAYVIDGGSSSLGVPQTFLVNAAGNCSGPIDSVMTIDTMISVVRAAYK